MRTITTALLFSICSSVAQAQSVGQLTGTKTLTSRPACPEIRFGASWRVEVSRQGNTFQAAPVAPILLNDAVAKRNEVAAKVELTDARGTIYLIPTAACYPDLKGARYRGEIPHSSTSMYRFLTRNVTWQGRTTAALTLQLDRGSVIVDWNRAETPLAVYLPFDSLYVVGTTVAIAVDSAGSNGFAYVHQGTIFVPSLQQTFTDGQIVRFGGPLGARAVQEGPIESLRETTRFYTTDLWLPPPPPPAGSSVSLLEAGAYGAVIGGAIYGGYKLYKWLFPGQREGTVVVVLPLRF